MRFHFLVFALGILCFVPGAAADVTGYIIEGECVQSLIQRTARVTPSRARQMEPAVLRDNGLSAADPCGLPGETPIRIRGSYPAPRAAASGPASSSPRPPVRTVIRQDQALAEELKKAREEAAKLRSEITDVRTAWAKDVEGLRTVHAEELRLLKDRLSREWRDSLRKLQTEKDELSNALAARKMADLGSALALASVVILTACVTVLLALLYFRRVYRRSHAIYPLYVEVGGVDYEYVENEGYTCRPCFKSGDPARRIAGTGLRRGELAVHSSEPYHTDARVHVSGAGPTPVGNPP